MKNKPWHIISILIACILLVLQTLIPHHHHGEENSTCTEKTHCEIADMCHEDLPEHEEHHDQSNNEICSFDLLDMLPASGGAQSSGKTFTKLIDISFKSISEVSNSYRTYYIPNFSLRQLLIRKSQDMIITAPLRGSPAC